jgi:hypothetical protein
MKMTALLLFIGCIQVSGKGFSQKVTLSLKNAPLVKAFESISRQTGYRFFYNQDQLQKSRPVSIQVKDVAIEEALSVCFSAPVGVPFLISVESGAESGVRWATSYSLSHFVF